MILLAFHFLLAFLFAAPPAQQPAAAADPVVYVCPPCGGDCHDRVFAEAGACPVCNMTLVPQNTMQKVAIFLYDGVEILDFSGPGEVFAATGRFQVFTVAATAEPIISQGFVRIVPQYTLDNCPRPDILVLPGGNTGPSVNSPRVIDWIRANGADDQIALSVCTGAFLLEAAGRLEGKKATTWHGAIANLRRKAANTEVLEDVRWVDNGNVITTAGVSAGIDGALHLVERLLGPEAAQRTARYMEYDKWKPGEGIATVKQ